MITHARGHQLRRGRDSQVGCTYHLTAVTPQRRTLFDDLRHARHVIQQLRCADVSGLSQTVAFVVMPDHLHWLVSLRRGTLSDLVQRAKSCSAAAINRARNTPGARIWQRGFHDHAVRGQEDLVQLARYVVANPLRAGLCTNLMDYPHWDAAWMRGAMDDLVIE